jgi:thiamine biosynthesis lipoprotein
LIPMPSSPLVHRFAHEAMGTTFEVLIAGCEGDYAGQASQAIFHQVDRLEALFSRFNAASEVSQINRLRPGRSLKIGIETYECLTTARRICSETGGAFDINFRARGQRPSPGKQSTVRKKDAICRADFEVSRTAEGFEVMIGREMIPDESSVLDLDLGGIGKGYALDRSAEILSDWGIDSALVHGGTSTAFAIGSAPGLGPGERGWPVGVGWAGVSSGSAKRVFLQNRALSGSGTEVKGRHILDPRTGGPASTHHAAWISHSEAAVADALSTAFMVMTTAEVKRFCSYHPEVWAFLIEPDGNAIFCNSDILYQPD